MGRLPTLDDKYVARDGAAFMTGTQALVRLPMAQMRRDRAAGLSTAGFISGYRGSPLGAYDQQLTLARRHLEPLDIRFQPGVNEELAATAIWGSQQLALSPGARHDGVLGIWYGKGPGVDRCGDVFRHGNAAGSAPHGGVLCLAGDDHAAKSSTVPHQSDHAFISASMPVLYPASIHEFIDTGLFGVALSRYSGCWVGIKVIADTVETSAVVALPDEHRAFIVPTDVEVPADGFNLRWPDPWLVQDERLLEHRVDAAVAFARANGIDRITHDSSRARFGIAASGKAFEEVREALRELGIDDAVAEAIGLRVYKVMLTWPLEPVGARAFADGLEEVLVIEERRDILEQQLCQQLYDLPSQRRPRIVGKHDETGRPLVPRSAVLSVDRVLALIGERLLRLPLEEGIATRLRERLQRDRERREASQRRLPPIERRPYFCSGCPHNTSTQVPEGSRAMAGIGCHFMAQWMDRRTETFTQMGGEGMAWAGIAPFTDEAHRFVNIGDGTYFHSGLLAIRASVAAGVNITYKVLYNDAVAMTGGQPLDGGLTPEQITWQLHAESVAPIRLVSDEPERYRAADLAPGTDVVDRSELDAVMRELRERPGCSAIVYAQTCAAEKRRRRKRGLLDEPDRRVFINTAVCEGCGDCSVQSNCVSIEPVETPWGRKRRINQSSCNKDYRCLDGFCPAMLTISGAQPARRGASRATASSVTDLPDAMLPEPPLPAMPATGWNIAITGVGGTGVLTIGALLGMAAHIDGKAVMVLDMAGLAQKGGAVLSHVKLADTREAIGGPHIVNGGADLLLAADAVVAVSRTGSDLCDPDRTVAIVNSSTAPTADIVGQRDADFRTDAVRRAIQDRVQARSQFLPFAALAETLVGDAIAANVMLLGHAWQSGLIPLSLEAMRAAIRLNGVALETNLDAFEHGRRLAIDPDAGARNVDVQAMPATPASLPLADLVAHHATHLVAYQGDALARRYRQRVEAMQARCTALGLDDDAGDALVRTLAQQYARLLACKDEYEVARLHTDGTLQAEIAAAFDGQARLTLHLAPPLLPGRAANGRPRKRAFGPWIWPLLRLLRHGRVLRGTPFDPFGYTRERRAERRWIRDYEADIDRLLAELDASRVSAAQAILAVPDAIRGFGPVKEAAMQAAADRRRDLWQGWEGGSSPAIIDAGARVRAV